MGNFDSEDAFTKTANLGQPFDVNCPAHGPSFGVSFAWTSKDTTLNVPFPRSDRVAINPVTGSMHIMYVTPEDIKKIEEFQGIRCSISGANTFYRSGPLTLQIPQGDDLFLFLHCFMKLSLLLLSSYIKVSVSCSGQSLPELRNLWYFSQNPGCFFYCHIL